MVHLSHQSFPTIVFGKCSLYGCGFLSIFIVIMIIIIFIIDVIISMIIS